MHNVTLIEGGKEAGRGDFRLFRLLEWSGYHRDNFQLYHLDQFDRSNPAQRSHVLVPMGFDAAVAFGVDDLLGRRGYVTHSTHGHYVVPTVHPSYIQRGQSKWSAPFIADIQKAVQLSRQGMPAQVLDYELDPSPMAAYDWAKAYLLALSMDPRTRLAFDIETPGKGDDEEDLEVGDSGPDRTWNIERIGFAYKPLGALSIPWAPEYMATIRACMGSKGEKVVWNAGFDVPRIKRVGVAIGGLVHDAMVAWHILHSDLPKSLKFVATFTCPWQPAWKHLSGSRPAFYNATDADVELRSMIRIEEELHKAGLWDVYQRDVVDLEPLLIYMSSMGMPIDPEVRLDRAVKLAEKQVQVLQEMESLYPQEARKIEHVYKNRPVDCTGLLSRPTVRGFPVCSQCGVEKPGKPHFRSFKKKTNPCSGAVSVVVSRETEEYYRLAEFTPSRDSLTRYHQVLKRPLPMTFDKRTRTKRVSFNEAKIKELMAKYPLDPLYPLVLSYREIDKIAGTYVGRSVEEANRS